ncbi:hypothetical protein ACOSQ3_017520 [Xanthoceras sorbifolium]
MTESYRLTVMASSNSSIDISSPAVHGDLNTSYYLCLTLLNSFCKLDVEFGEILWKTFMLPDNNGDTGGYAGAAVWGSSPSIDIHRNHDFGEAPMMLSIQVEGLKKDIVVAVQKSGFAWAMDHDNGSHVLTMAYLRGWTWWHGGGGNWGAATDEKMIYTNIANSNGKNFILKQSNKTTTSGRWVAMDARSGKTLWSIADPNKAIAFGPVTLANGVLFSGSTNGM